MRILTDEKGNVFVADGMVAYATESIDPNIKPGNIKKGVDIMGVTGNYAGEGGGSAINDVTFIDYDGTVVYSYTTEEFLALTDFPDNPSHDGLVAQGWNWPFNEAQTYVQKHGKLVIGQMYITDDRKTRIYVHMYDGHLLPTLVLLYNGDPNDIKVDWGVGSGEFDHDFAEGRFVGFINKYQEPGDYVITITCRNNTEYMLGYFVEEYNINSDYNLSLWPFVKKVEIGAGCAGFTPMSKINETLFIESISIPDSMSYIGMYNTINMNGIVVPRSVTSLGPLQIDNIDLNFTIHYNYCEYVSLPYGLQTIGDSGINGNNIKILTIPDTVYDIDDYGIAYNTFLSDSTIILSDGLTYTPSLSGTSVKHLVISGDSCGIMDDMIVLEDITFSGFSSLSIGNICENPSLRELDIPEGIESIENINSMYALVSLSLPNTLTEIGDYCFYDLHYIKDIIIPNSVTSIGNDCFYALQSLTELIIPNSVTSIGDRCFYNLPSLTELTIPNSVTSIGEYVFYNLPSLTELTIPNSVTSIGEYVFCDLPNLTELIIPNSVTSIGDKCFCDLSNLTELTIPNSVTSIGSYCFYNMPAPIYMQGTVPPSVGGSTVENLRSNNNTIYVPTSAYNAYINAAGWSTISNQIQTYEP